MGFKVRFIFQIDAVLVAKVIPVRGIRIMGVADMVDVGTLHQHDFFLHLLASDGMAHRGIRLVAIDSFQFGCLSVDVVITACQPEFVFGSRSIFYLYFTETDISGNDLYGTSFLVFKLSHERIAIGLLGRPQHRGFLRKSGPAGNNLTFSHRSDSSSSCTGSHQGILIRIDFIGVK